MSAAEFVAFGPIEIGVPISLFGIALELHPSMVEQFSRDLQPSPGFRIRTGLSLVDGIKNEIVELFDPDQSPSQFILKPLGF